MVNNNPVVRLPLFDPMSNDLLPGYLEVDTEFFLSSVRGLRSNQARIVDVVSKYPELPEPLTADQEIDLIDRIISGLPVEYSQPANPEGNAVYPKGKLYDVNSLHPQEFTNKIKLTDERMSDALIEAANTWRRIPEYEDYEINPLGVIRNRWTKRVIEITEDGDQKYVAMHDKHGFEHAVNVSFAMEKVYGK